MCVGVDGWCVCVCVGLSVLWKYGVGCALVSLSDLSDEEPVNYSHAKLSPLLIGFCFKVFLKKEERRELSCQICLQLADYSRTSYQKNVYALPSSGIFHNFPKLTFSAVFIYSQRANTIKN